MTLVVVTELVGNVARHTDDGGELTLTLQGDSILVEVADSSPRRRRCVPATPAGSAGAAFSWSAR